MNRVLAEVRTQIVALLPRLRRFCRTLTRNVHDADDLLQIAIERALARYEQWRPDTRLESWLFGIIRNAWIDEVRARGRRGRVFLPEEFGEQVAAPGADADADATGLSVQEAMERLPDEQRLAVSLVLIEGLSYREAAEVMAVPIGTLTSRLARGRRTLQALLGDVAEEK